jgi:flavorubredoxin
LNDNIKPTIKNRSVSPLKKALIIYWSKTGNTKKVASAIKEGLEKAAVEVEIKKPQEAKDVDYFNYDLICVGSPSYRWHPPKPLSDFLKRKHRQYHQQGKVKLGSPKVEGKKVLIFCTYSGPHTGIEEAIPCGKYLRQFFEHLGFTVLDEWYIPSEYHGWKERSTKGRLGDIRGKPTQQELQEIERKAQKLVPNLN